MKHFSYLITLLFFVSCSQQESTLIGHWWTCNSQMGYSETLISDSTIHYISERQLNSAPILYQSESKKRIKPTENSVITLINENIAISEYNGSVDTLHRLAEKVTTQFDYNCAENLTRSEFRQILNFEYFIRKIKSDVNCSSSFPSKVNGPPITLAEFDSTLFQKSSHFISIADQQFEFKRSSLYESSKPLTKERFTFNKDSTRVLIQFQKATSCNDDFRADATLHKDGSLNIYLIQNLSYCPDSCIIDFYLFLSHYNTLKINTVNTQLINQ